VTIPAVRRLIVGNWKMNLGESAAREFVAALRQVLPFDRIDAVVAPAFPCLRAVLDAASGSPLIEPDRSSTSATLMGGRSTG